MTGLMIIHFPKREAFYSHTNSWSIIHDTLNSLIKKKNSISAELDLNLVFLCIGFIKIMTHDQKKKKCYNLVHDTLDLTFAPCGPHLQTLIITGIISSLQFQFN